MKIRLNGELVVLEEATTLMDVLSKFKVQSCTPRIAVAVNEQIVFRNRWSEFWVNEGDLIEVVSAAQGG